MGFVCFSTHVAAPVDRVFGLHVDGSRMPEWFPGVQAYEGPPEPLDREGIEYVLRFGSLFRSRARVTGVQRPRFHRRTWDAAPLGSAGTATVFFGPEGAGTRVDFEAQYRLPLGPLGRLAERLPGVQRAAERSMRREIDSFRKLAEREHATHGA